MFDLLLSYHRINQKVNLWVGDVSSVDAVNKII